MRNLYFYLLVALLGFGCGRGDVKNECCGINWSELFKDHDSEEKSDTISRGNANFDLGNVLNEVDNKTNLKIKKIQENGEYYSEYLINDMNRDLNLYSCEIDQYLREAGYSKKLNSIENKDFVDNEKLQKLKKELSQIENLDWKEDDTTCSKSVSNAVKEFFNHDSLYNDQGIHSYKRRFKFFVFGDWELNESKLDNSSKEIINSFEQKIIKAFDDFCSKYELEYTYISNENNLYYFINEILPGIDNNPELYEILKKYIWVCKADKDFEKKEECHVHFNHLGIEQNSVNLETSCPICKEILNKELSVCTRINCNNCNNKAFHKNCLDSWLNIGNTSCPTCRSSAIKPDHFIFAPHK